MATVSGNISKGHFFHNTCTVNFLRASGVLCPSVSMCTGLQLRVNIPRLDVFAHFFFPFFNHTLSSL